jgi:hypothetical protein
VWWVGWGCGGVGLWWCGVVVVWGCGGVGVWGVVGVGVWWVRSNIPRSALCATLDTYNFKYLKLHIFV